LITNRYFYSLIALAALMPLTACADSAEESNDACLKITLTGTQGGPAATSGQAGSGTLIQYGAVESGCADLLLQFDVGRGTTRQLSKLGFTPNQIDAVFLTHLHSDHSEGLIDMLQLRWHFFGDEIDVVCSADVTTNRPPPERVMSCRNFVAHTADALIYSGEIAQRYAENNKRRAEGPKALVNLVAVNLPLPSEPGTVVWESGDVSVSAVGTVHIAGSLAYRVDTPAGSVVIGGDAGNSKAAPPRASSTSESVEALAIGADVLVHSVIHPAFAPGAGSTFPPPIYLRQSSAEDLGAMARRAGIGHLVLTHLIPAADSPSHGPFVVPGGPLSRDDFAAEARKAGFDGEIHVGEDLLSLQLP
jgi:ribonuclease Z